MIWKTSVAGVVLGLILSAGPGVSRAGELVDQIVAVVNKETVLQSELDEVLDYAMETELRGLEGEERAAALADIRSVLLDSLIATLLMEQAMDRADDLTMKEKLEP